MRGAIEIVLVAALFGCAVMAGYTTADWIDRIFRS